MKDEMADGGRIRMTPEVAERIRRHGAETYPHECCGALFGKDGARERDEAGEREIVELLALTNRRKDSPQNRFSVAPRDVIDADRVAQACGLELVGWYHSHPDHPAKPSEYDREHAWPWYSYVIVKVENGVAQEMTSWRLLESRERYVEEEIQEVKETKEAKQ